MKPNQNNWQKIKLGKICKIVSGTTPNTNESLFWNGTLPWITPAEIHETSHIICETERFITEKAVEKNALKLLPKGTVLLTSRAPIGKVGIAGIEMYCNQGFKNLICSDEIYNEYLYFFLKFKSKYLDYLGRGATFKEISKSIVENVLILLPPLSEQHRIVAVLETWDKAISLTKRLIEQKEIQKKHLIFSFVLKAQNTREYIVKDVFNLTRGRVISENYIKENTGIYPVYSSQTTNDGILGYISSYDFNGEYLTWTTDGANAGKVFYRNGKFNCTNVCGLAIPKIAIDLKYVSAYLNLITKRYVSYVGNPKLMNNVFGTMVFKVPNYTYQKNISAVLSVADKEISLLKEKLAKLQQQKKGLMQILLTGKVRLN